MSRTTNESEDEMIIKDQMDLPSIDEGSCGGGAVLKKGPWTSAEDAMLVDYVKKHGEGNWNSVQKHSGLSRCGKSCRLRWANHLRPNLKKGAFTEDEEQVIVELHAKMGNKWARMAAHLQSLCLGRRVLNHQSRSIWLFRSTTNVHYPVSIGITSLRSLFS